MNIQKYNGFIKEYKLKIWNEVCDVILPSIKEILDSMNESFEDYSVSILLDDCFNQYYSSNEDKRRLSKRRLEIIAGGIPDTDMYEILVEFYFNKETQIEDRDSIFEEIKNRIGSEFSEDLSIEREVNGYKDITNPTMGIKYYILYGIK